MRRSLMLPSSATPIDRKSAAFAGYSPLCVFIYRVELEAEMCNYLQK
jgi:hypothetical protein